MQIEANGEGWGGVHNCPPPNHPHKNMILYHEWALVHERSISPHCMKESQKEFEIFIGVVACRFLVYKYEYQYKYQYEYKSKYKHKSK